MQLRSWVIALLAAIFIGLAEVSFFKLLPFPWHELKPVLIGGVLLIVLQKSREAVAYAALSGFILDAFSLGDSTFALARLPLIMLGLTFISATLLTNRSVYSSIAMIVTARLFDRLWVSAASLIIAFLFKDEISFQSWNYFVVTLAWDVVMVTTIFIFLAIFTRRFLVSFSSSSRFYDT